MPTRSDNWQSFTDRLHSVVLPELPTCGRLIRWKVIRWNILLTCGAHSTFIVNSSSWCRSALSRRPFRTTWPIRSCLENRSKSYTVNCRYRCFSSSYPTLKSNRITHVKQINNCFTIFPTTFTVLTYSLLNHTHWSLISPSLLVLKTCVGLGLFHRYVTVNPMLNLEHGGLWNILRLAHIL